ncbi:MAG: T9SS type A sorting domain-containing protein [Bacteroidia bacterium]|nr:T9SS type A sorting domain-containing protein [Bacteroidia bacterium]
MKQIDENGAYVYTNIIRVENVVIAQVNTSVQPNPFQNNLQVNITSPSASDAIITITDIAGKTIKEMKVSCLEGDNTIAINNLDYLSSGVYFVNVKVDNSITNHKLIRR